MGEFDLVSSVTARDAKLRLDISLGIAIPEYGTMVSVFGLRLADNRNNRTSITSACA